MSDYYSTLGVGRDATAEDIKQAYKRQAMRHHPDRGGNAAEFQKIQEAYDTLGDAGRRQQYDNPNPFGGQGFPGGFQFHFGGGAPGGDPFGDIFGQMFRQTMIARVNLEIDLETVARGGRRSVQINGQVLELEIPQGVESGEELRYQGVGPNGADLIARYTVKEHPRFQRRGLDLVTAIQVDFWDLILGCQREIQGLLDDKFTITVPERFRPGQTLRARDRGLRRNGQQGHMLVEVQAVMPDDIPEDILSRLRQIKAV